MVSVRGGGAAVVRARQSRVHREFNLVDDLAFILKAWYRVRGNKGGRGPGVDGIAPSFIESPEVIRTEPEALFKAR